MGRITGHSENVSSVDDKDRALLQAREEARAKLKGPLVGDFVRCADGNLERFAHDWGDGLQTCTAGSFYLLSTGWASMSGGLYPAIPRESITETQEKLPGSFWFFHHDVSGAAMGIQVEIDCPVYTTTANSGWRK